MAAEVKKINIGCGPNASSGWINIDNSPNALLSKLPLLKKILFKLRLISAEQFNAQWKNHPLFLDVRKGLPFTTESIDFIYSSHFLEHLTIEEVESLLLECNRVLKDKGVMRLVLPDLKKAALQYAKGEKNAEEFLSWLNFFEKKPRHRHKWLYDFGSLKQLLQKTGFGKIKRTACGKSVVPDAEKLDSRKEDSFFVDAWK